MCSICFTHTYIDKDTYIDKEQRSTLHCRQYYHQKSRYYTRSFRSYYYTANSYYYTRKEGLKGAAINSSVETGFTQKTSVTTLDLTLITPHQNSYYYTSKQGLKGAAINTSVATVVLGALKSFQV